MVCILLRQFLLFKVKKFHCLSCFQCTRGADGETDSVLILKESIFAPVDTTWSPFLNTSLAVSSTNQKAVVPVMLV